MPRSILKTERSLGFNPPGGLYRYRNKCAWDAVRELSTGTEALKDRFRSQRLTRPHKTAIVATFLSVLGPQIWPDYPVRAGVGWLTLAESSDFAGLYPCDLYWSKHEAQILNLFRILVVAKAETLAANQGRRKLNRVAPTESNILFAAVLPAMDVTQASHSAYRLSSGTVTDSTQDLDPSTSPTAMGADNDGPLRDGSSDCEPPKSMRSHAVSPIPKLEAESFVNHPTRALVNEAVEYQLSAWARARSYTILYDSLPGTVVRPDSVSSDEVTSRKRGLADSSETDLGRDVRSKSDNDDDPADSGAPTRHDSTVYAGDMIMQDATRTASPDAESQVSVSPSLARSEALRSIAQAPGAAGGSVLADDDDTVEHLSGPSTYVDRIERRGSHEQCARCGLALAVAMAGSNFLLR